MNTTNKIIEIALNWILCSFLFVSIFLIHNKFKKHIKLLIYICLYQNCFVVIIYSFFDSTHEPNWYTTPPSQMRMGHTFMPEEFRILNKIQIIH
jgi:hypothetical protein